MTQKNEKNNNREVLKKLASYATALFMALNTSSVLESNAYASEINPEFAINTEIPEEKYKEGSIIEGYLNIDDVQYNGYVVKRGDNTSRISQKISKFYDVEMTTKYWPVIAYYNNYPRTIKPGEILLFPGTLEDMEEVLSNLKQTGWLAKYVQYNGVYKNQKRQMKIGEVIDEIYGKGASQDPEFVLKYLKLVGFDIKKYNASSELNGDLYFKLTDWIPTTEELGIEPSTQKTKQKNR